MLKVSSLRSRSPNGRGVRAGRRDQHPPSLYVARPSKSGWGVDDSDVVLRSGGTIKASSSREPRGPQRRHRRRRRRHKNRGSREGRKEGVVVVVVAVRIAAGRPRRQGCRGARGAWSRGMEGGMRRRGGRRSPAARKRKKREEEEGGEGLWRRRQRWRRTTRIAGWAAWRTASLGRHRASPRRHDDDGR